MLFGEMAEAFPRGSQPSGTDSYPQPLLTKHVLTGEFHSVEAQKRETPTPSGVVVGQGKVDLRLEWKQKPSCRGNGLGGPDILDRACQSQATAPAVTGVLAGPGSAWEDWPAWLK